MKVTMIGASGFVGTRLLDLLRAEPLKYECRNIDLQPSHFFDDVTTIGDVRNQEQMDRELKGSDVVVLLAAQHRDDVTPTSLYYDTNVGGMEATLRAMEKNGVKRIAFFSSVAVYGLNKNNPDENHPADPFNHYGKSKWQAEQVLQKWYETHPDWNIDIIRPTVIFGERNRGNVYNLLKQIASGKFLMGYNVFNYIDKPDNNMNQLVAHISKVLNKHIPATHFPYALGMLGGYCFDILAKITGKKLAVSSVRVKKFCATTQFDARKAHSSGFEAPYTLDEGLARTLEFEFVHPRVDDITFKTE